MKRAKISLVVVIVLIGPALGLLFQGDLFGGYLATIALLSGIVPLFLALLLVGLGVWIWKRRIGPGLTFALILCFAALSSALGFEMAQMGLDRWKNDAVNNYVEHAATVLDRIKARDGRYPSELPVSVLGKPPSLLKDYGSYSSDGQSFTFEYVDDPAGWAGGEGALIFSSSYRRWVEER